MIKLSFLHVCGKVCGFLSDSNFIIKTVISPFWTARSKSCISPPGLTRPTLTNLAILDFTIILLYLVIIDDFIFNYVKFIHFIFQDCYHWIFISRLVSLRVKVHVYSLFCCILAY